MYKKYLLGYGIILPFYDEPGDGSGGGALDDDKVLEDNSDDSKDDEDLEDKKDEDENEDVKDKDKDEEEDTEEEKEEEEDTEEEKLTSWTDIKTKYPDIGKEFPELKQVFFREQAFSEVFGSVEAAKDAATQVETLQVVENDLFNNGDPSNLLSLIKKESPEALPKVLFRALQFAQENDKDLYYELAAIPIKQLLRNSFNAGKDTDLGKAAQILHEHFFGHKDFAKDPDGMKNLTKTDKSKKEIELEERLSKIEERDAAAFQSSIDDSYINSMRRSVLSGLDKDERIGDYLKDKLVDDILRDVAEQLSKDSRYVNTVKSLAKQARSNGFPSELKARILNTALARAKPLVPKIREKLVSKALGKEKKPEAKPEKKEVKFTTQGKGTIKKDTTFKSDLDVLRAN